MTQPTVPTTEELGFVPEGENKKLAALPQPGPDDDFGYKMTGYLANSKSIVKRPNLVTALTGAGASQAEMHAMDEFTYGLQLQRQVETARAAGTKLDIKPSERATLDNLGVHYDDVYESAEKQIEDQQLAAIKQQNLEPVYQGGKLVGAREKTDAEKGISDGWFDSFGGFFKHLGKATADVGLQSLDKLGMGWKYVSANVGGAIDDVRQGFGAAAPDKGTYDELKADKEAILRGLGYNPDSWVSRQAATARGLMPGDVSKLVNQYGLDKVVMAARYSKDGDAFRQQYINEVTDPAEQAARLKELGSEDFQKLVAQYELDRPSVGNRLAQGLFASPLVGERFKTLAGSDLQQLRMAQHVSGVQDLVASFVADPLVLAGKARTGIKIAQVGIKDVSLTDRAAHVLNPANNAHYAKPVQRGLQNAVDNANRIRQAEEALTVARASGDAERVKSATADLEAANKVWQDNNAVWDPIRDALTGKQQFLAHGDDYKPITRGGEPLDTYDKAVDYLVKQAGITQVVNGGVLREAAYMPGAMSKWAASRVRQGMQSARAGRRAVINFNKVEDVKRLLPNNVDAEELHTGTVLAGHQAIDEATQNLQNLHDSIAMFESKLADGSVSAAARPGVESTLQRLKGRVPALQGEVDQAKAGLASAKRAQQNSAEALAGQATPEALGEAQFNLRRTGTLDASKLSLVPRTIENIRVAMGRNPWTELPSRAVVDIRKPETGRVLRQYMKTYLDDAQVNSVMAAWWAGDANTRRAIVRSTRLQVAHAAGAGHTKAGREILDRIKADHDSLYATNEHSTVPTDPWTGDADKSFAVFPGQTRDTYELDNFRDLHRASAKTGFLEATIGRALNSRAVDSVFNQWRWSSLARAATVPRNTGESRIYTALRGETAQAAGVKALITRLGGFVPDRVWYTKALMENPLTATVGRGYRGLVEESLDPEIAKHLQWVAEHHPEDAQAVMDNFSLGHQMDAFTNKRVDEAAAMIREGIIPQKVTYRTPEGEKVKFEGTGWTELEPVGQSGTDAWARQLSLTMKDTPQLTQQVIAYLEARPAAKPGEFQKIVDMMRDNPEVAQHIDGMELANMYEDAAGVTRVVVTKEDKEQALTQLAHRQAAALRDLLTNADGKYIEKVAAKLKAGEVPSFDFLDRFGAAERPAKVVGPSYVPKIEGETFKDKVAALATAVQDTQGRIYQRAVEDQIARTVSLPIYWMKYGEARKQLSSLEKHIVENEGRSPEFAAEVAHRQAMQSAFARVRAYIDDASVRSQMDVVHRNFFLFSRAWAQFLQRVGAQAKLDPFQFQKLVLATEGSEATGLTYTDQNGDLKYTFPGSDLALQAIGKVGKFMGVPDDFLTLPVTGTLSGKVMQVSPGFSNPLRPSFSPMINVPARWLAGLDPSHAAFYANVDQFFNNQSWGSSPAAQMLPSSVRRWMETFDDNEREGAYADAGRAALMNMVASGKFPMDAAPGSPEQKQALRTLQIQARNVLGLRAILSWFSPGSPGAPQYTADNVKPDEWAKASGIRDVRSEFLQLIDDMGGDTSRAAAVWAELHPDWSIFTQPTTVVGQAKAQIPATAQFEKWVEENQSFIKQFPQTWAYFAPSEPGPFDAVAYRTQMGMGIRRHLSAEEILDAYETRKVADDFFANDDSTKAKIAQLQKQGDLVGAEALKRRYRVTANTQVALNPELKAYLDGSPADQRVAMNQLDELRKYAAQFGGPVADLISAYDAHSQRISQLQVYGNTGAQTIENEAFQQRMASMVQAHPELLPIYNGVFRKADASNKSLYTLLQQQQASQ